MKKLGLVSILSALCGSVYANIQHAVLMSEPSGYGQKITAVELTYETAPQAVEMAQFTVTDRTITGISQAENQVRLYLSAEDEKSGVTFQPVLREPSVERLEPVMITQTMVLTDVQGKPIAPQTVQAVKTVHQVVDDFQQRQFKDKSGIVVKYNLFIPKNYDPTKRYPLVMFLHDAGATNSNVKNTLWQGNGATTWASEAWQAKYPAFVLAPQFDHAIVNDQSDDPVDLDPIINLIKALSEEYAIDTQRLYTTGQSGGAMMSIAMNIKYPDFFAGSYLVAGQWAAEKTVPMAKNHLFIFVSEDDLKAFPGQNAITEVLAKEGAVVHKTVLENGNGSRDEIEQAVKKLLENTGNVYYMAVRTKTLPDQVKDPHSTNKGQAHIGTWKIAYDIDAIKMWLFEQRKR